MTAGADPRIGYAANAIWRAMNPGDRKTPPPEEAADYRAAGLAVVRMFDEAATASVQVEHGADDSEQANEAAEKLAQRVAELEQQLVTVRELLAREIQSVDDLRAGNLELVNRHQQATSAADALRQQITQLEAANEELRAEIKPVGKERVEIRWLIPRSDGPTTVEYGVRKHHEVHVTLVPAGVAEDFAGAQAAEVVCRRVTPWEPAKPHALVSAAAPSSNGHTLPSDVEKEFRRARASLAGTAKMRPDDPRRVAAQVAFQQAKAAREATR